MLNGLPIFTLANKARINKGWIPTSRGGKNLTIPFIGVNEERALLYFEFRSDIMHIERADIDQYFGDKYNIYVSPHSPLIIPYQWEGKTHNYYPDYLLKLTEGRYVVAEIGDKDEKLKGANIAKALAAIEYCKERGWEYWLILDDNIMSENRFKNYLLLKSFDKEMYRNPEITDIVLSLILNSPNLTVQNIFDNLTARGFSKNAVEMAVSEFICRVAKEGKLVFDFDKDKINKLSVISILEDNIPLCIPANINLPYETIIEISLNQIKSKDDTSAEIIDQPDCHLPIIDESFFPEEKKDAFLKKRAAVLEAISVSRRDSIKRIAEKYGLKRQTLDSIIKRYMEKGEAGLLGYSEYKGKDTFLSEDLQLIIKKLMSKKPKWTAMNIYRSEEFKNEILKLYRKTNTMTPMPGYHQVYRFYIKVQKDKELSENINNGKTRKGKITTLGAWVRTIVHRLEQVQVDSQYMDIKIITSDGKEVAGRIWSIVFVDVKTALITGYSLSLKAPMEEDYMIALKCCIEPKDKIVNKFGCKYTWPSNGIPIKILSDNGRIFISERSTDVLVKRLGICEEMAPTYAPDVKGVIETIFSAIEKELISLLPGYTKDRDPEEVRKEALNMGITYDIFEKLFVKHIVESYNMKYDDLRGAQRFALWVADSQKEELNTPQWIMSNDELKLLLMKEERSRIVDRHGVSFRDRYYQNLTMLKALQGQKVFIRYDKQDISVIYIFKNDGTYYCEVYCPQLAGERRSVWEDEIIKKCKKGEKTAYNMVAMENTRTNISEAKTSAKKNRKYTERQAQYIEQKKIYDNRDIHLESVKENLASMRVKNGDIDYEEIKPVALKDFKFRKTIIRDI